jgi:hypothetical protein
MKLKDRWLNYKTHGKHMAISTFIKKVYVGLKIYFVYFSLYEF